jgi:hypothetical protein
VDDILESEHILSSDTLPESATIYWCVRATDNQQTLSWSDTSWFHHDLPATYWVDGTTGDDNNPGTRAARWATIQHAADVMGPWSRVWVIEGMYDEGISCNTTGKPDSQIVFQAYPGNESPAIVGGQGANVFGFQLQGVSHLLIDGFEMQNQSMAAIDISSSGMASSHNTVKNLNVTSGDVLNCIHISGDAVLRE